MRFQFLLLLLIAMVCNNATAQKKKPASKAIIAQGICGSIVWKEGNLMPSPDKPTPQGTPVIRELFVYQLTNQAQVTMVEDVFYKDIKTKLIKTIKSDKNGKFCMNLPTGTYSIFSKEDKGLFANGFDGEMNIFPVEVKAKQQTKIIFEINYKAVY
jgi:hypothetical protein